MKFQEAFQQMKQGKKIKLPSWGGYWTWDEEKQTILMHCRPGNSDTGNPVMDIRETQRVEYTLENICSEEWIIADEANTPILGGVALFGFGEAIKYIQRGLKVARVGWNGPRMWLCLAGAVAEAPQSDFDLTEEIKGFLPWIGIKTVGDGFVPWTPSQIDMLACDWVIVE